MTSNKFPGVLNVLYSKALFASLKYSYLLPFHSMTRSFCVSHEWKLCLNQSTSSKIYVGGELCKTSEP